MKRWVLTINNECRNRKLWKHGLELNGQAVKTTPNQDNQDNHVARNTIKTKWGLGVYLINLIKMV